MHHITAITGLKERGSRLRACVVVVWSERCRWGVREEGETRVVVGYDGTRLVIMIMVIMVILFWRWDWGSRMLGGTGGELEHFEGRSKARRRRSRLFLNGTGIARRRHCFVRGVSGRREGGKGG